MLIEISIRNPVYTGGITGGYTQTFRRIFDLPIGPSVGMGFAFWLNDTLLYGVIDQIHWEEKGHYVVWLKLAERFRNIDISQQLIADGRWKEM